ISQIRNHHFEFEQSCRQLDMGSKSGRMPFVSAWRPGGTRCLNRVVGPFPCFLYSAFSLLFTISPVLVTLFFGLALIAFKPRAKYRIKFTIWHVRFGVSRDLRSP